MSHLLLFISQRKLQMLPVVFVFLEAMLVPDAKLADKRFRLEEVSFSLLNKEKLEQERVTLPVQVFVQKI